jgi:hypothetical protein
MEIEMKKFFKKFFKKEESKFTGIEVKVWENGKLLTHHVSCADQIFSYRFPCGSILKTPSGNDLIGYDFVPHLERM